MSRRTYLNSAWAYRLLAHLQGDVLDLAKRYLARTTLADGTEVTARGGTVDSADAALRAMLAQQSTASHTAVVVYSAGWERRE